MAVNQCVQAAGFEFDQQIQKVLIKAAKFGKTFAPDIPSKPYVQMCRILRVLNGVRCNKIGIPLTYIQYPFNIIQYIGFFSFLLSKLI